MIGFNPQFVLGSLVLVLCLSRCKALVDGGGECGTDGDCNYNGVCENDPTKKEVCMCVKQFGGSYCEEKLAKPMQGYKDAPGKPKVSIKITTKDVKETADADAKKGRKRELEKLEFDKESNIIGISPEVLASSGQEFMIYSPITKLYMFVSFDKTLTGKKFRAHVEGRGDRYGDRNIFTMKKLPSGKYRIHNEKTNSDVYISNSKSGFIGFRTNDILASDVTAKDQPKAEKFEFEFELNQDGTYGIKSHDNKYWFVSHDRAGIPSYRILSADDKNREKYQTQKFQLVVKYPAKSVEMDYDLENKELKETKDIKCHREVFKNANEKGADTTHTVNYQRTVSSTVAFREAKEFSITGELTTGLTLDSVLKLTGKLSVTKKKTTETTETKEVSETETITQEIITKPGQINCVVLLMTRAEIKVPYTMTAVTKEGKKIEAKGVLEGVIHKDFHLSIEGGELKTKKKCDWE